MQFENKVAGETLPIYWGVLLNLLPRAGMWGSAMAFICLQMVHEKRHRSALFE